MVLRAISTAVGRGQEEIESVGNWVTSEMISHPRPKAEWNFSMLIEAQSQD